MTKRPLSSTDGRLRYKQIEGRPMCTTCGTRPCALSFINTKTKEYFWRRECNHCKVERREGKDESATLSPLPCLRSPWFPKQGEVVKQRKYHVVTEDASDLRSCNRCSENLPRTKDFFSVDRTCLFGLNPICRGCENSQAVSHRRMNINERLAKEADYREQTRDSRRLYRRNRYARMRWEVLMHYSNGHPMCACCGECEYEFLSVDHIDGGGTEQKKRDRALGTDFYFWLKKNNFPEGYRILCHNCNGADGYYGMCPHHRRRLEFGMEPTGIQCVDVYEMRA